jgi:GNAT superfamily N-acetyltransferase
VDLRIAAVSDALAITSLINAAFRVEKFFIDGDRIDVDQVKTFLGEGEFLLLEDAEGLAGCVYIKTRTERAYLGLLSIDPERQRSGLGSCLVQAAEDHARGRGCRSLDLQIVNVRAELPGFYTALGYTANGTAPFSSDVPTKMPCHFVKMWKAL